LPTNWAKRIITQNTSNCERYLPSKKRATYLKKQGTLFKTTLGPFPKKVIPTSMLGCF